MGLKIEKLTKKTPVYDIKVQDNENFYANGVLVHNCQEINLPTTPITDVNKDDGEIALCVLSAINLGKIKQFSDLEPIVRQIVFTLDRIIDIQEYIVPAAGKMKKRRSIGIGVTNFAYWLAKNGYDYESDESMAAIDELFEHIQFYALKASMELAKEYGPCEYFDRTKYSEGLLPIDHYSSHVDSIVDRKPTLDWDWLREQILKYGLRNSTLTALMPCESSSVVSSSTNGMEPPRRLITIKTSKSGAPLPVVLPEINKLKNKYQMAFTFSNESMNKVVSIAQKWIDQGISVNHYYDKRGYEKGLLPLSEVVNDILHFYKFGGKQLYYANSIDNSKKIEDNDASEKQTLEELVELSNEDNCEGGACAL